MLISGGHISNRSITFECMVVRHLGILIPHAINCGNWKCLVLVGVLFYMPLCIACCEMMILDCQLFTQVELVIVVFEAGRIL